jgi:hypothetical protein
MLVCMTLKVCLLGGLIETFIMNEYCVSSLDIESSHLDLRLIENSVKYLGCFLRPLMWSCDLVFFGIVIDAHNGSLLIVLHYILFRHDCSLPVLLLQKNLLCYELVKGL